MVHANVPPGITGTDGTDGLQLRSIPRLAEATASDHPAGKRTTTEKEREKNEHSHQRFNIF